MAKKVGLSLGLPIWAKAAIVIVAVGGTAFAVWRVYKYVRQIGDNRDDRQNVNASLGTLNTLSNQGVRPTYYPAQYTSWANSLEQAFDGCGVGWATQVGVWKAMKNDADIHSLITAYGTKTIDKCGLGTGDFKGDLPSTLAYKYSGTEASAALPYSSIPIINAILRKNGVSFQF